MGKVRPEERHFDLRVKSLGKGEPRLRRVVEIRYVPTPDAEARLSRAIAILLNAAAINASQSKAITDIKKKEEDGPLGGDEGDFHG